MKAHPSTTQSILRRVRRLARRERGAQLAELAIALPLMLLLFGATAEFGRYFYTYTTLSKATRAGARYLATAENKAAENVRAENLVIYGNPEGEGAPVVAGLTPARVVIRREGAASASGEKVTVAIEGYEYQPLFDLGKLTGIDGLSLEIDVKPSTTMRYLRTQPLL